MPNLKRFVAILLCAVMVLLLTACDNSDEAYLYFNLTEKPSTIDPQTASSDTELLIVRNIFEGLLRKDADGKIVCGVAESYEKNGLTISYDMFLFISGTCTKLD